MNNLRILKISAILEGISYLLLFGLSMPLKYYYNMPEPNYYIGMAHGLLFVVYCVWVLIVAREKKWSAKIIIWSWIASLLPFGTFVVDKKWFK